ncbi:VirB6/TrbL-like conjugal transfer protein, CD1112 family [Faecalibacterium prausnitzii]|uniref:VirB6/TrbL-like conjugal transfer protein, CD1112 family n=1 Tax=Faecalibacterium prausnitzii TaxID=853 RepID=UPI001FA870CF|nr:CD0415/CD1112 family protein [Faecalibacterium prausnitzii]
MPKSNANLALKGLDEMFSTEESRQEQKREQVQQIPIEELFPFKEHPFKVLDDEAMQRTVESVAQYGVLAPLIARPRPEGGYEIISGHRRQYAAKLAGLDTLPVIVRQMSDDGTVILMVDSNLQREHILPSERAFAYKMKLDAIKNQGARSDLTSTQVAQKLSVEKVGDDAGVSKDTIRRFIRLTNLIPELLDIDISGVVGDLETQLADWSVGALLGLWFQSVFVGLCTQILSICIFLVIYGRMIEVYLVTSIGPIPFATMVNREWGSTGQNYLRSLLALGFQAFLIMICMGIYAVLVEGISTSGDNISAAIWGCMGYTVLLCYTLFKTGSLAKSLFGAH